MAKLYTRTGDDGTTGLFGGGRVLKDHPRIEAYGTVDELNAALGLAAAALIGHAADNLRKPDDGEAPAPFSMEQGRAFESFRIILSRLQSRLFDIGADLATPHGSPHESKVHRINHRHIAEIEQWIDEVDAGNTPMKHFVLPGGTELAARLHLARTICRRAERAMIHLRLSETVNADAIIYINRASDLLFAMARRANKETGVKDVEWIPQPQLKL